MEQEGDPWHPTSPAEGTILCPGPAGWPRGEGRGRRGAGRGRCPQVARCLDREAGPGTPSPKGLGGEGGGARAAEIGSGRSEALLLILQSAERLGAGPRGSALRWTRGAPDPDPGSLSCHARGGHQSGGAGAPGEPLGQ